MELINLSRQALNLLKVVLTRAIIFYFLCFFVTSMIVDQKRIMFGIKTRIIERVMPDNFLYLVDYSKGHKAFDLKQFKKYTKFYEKIVEFYPERADALGMLGYCYYHASRKKMALAAFKSAIVENPNFFWFYYNQGVLNYQLGRYRQAVDSLSKALTISKNDTLEYILSSKVIFRSILISSKAFQFETKQRLQNGYDDCYRLMVLSYFHLEDYSSMYNVALAAGKMPHKINNPGHYSYYAGIAAFHLKDYMKAIYYFQQSGESMPWNFKAYRYWGLSLKALHKDELAEHYFKQSENKRKSNPMIEQINILEGKKECMY